ncbi:hypothetical protein SteCoe_16756 [Stentor coeruleus]|uniref:Uncharacterized protein n=1 Tax=Stentor coeruleus TaxID=5963 RepID=A0A1R2C0M4_9CILI|nr:hypothetical protein SteCoe_16756 [Stentor coeruleus]
MEFSCDADRFQMHPSRTCTIIKNNGLFPQRPIKKFPQTNLIHKKKIKRLGSESCLSEKRKNIFLYQLNAFTKVKVTVNLKEILDKLLVRNPRCKIFRDLYQEKSFNEEEIVFSKVFTLEKDQPLLDLSLNKKIYETLIVSNKSMLMFNQETTCIDNDFMMIYNEAYPPIVKATGRNMNKPKFEYNFIQFPMLSSAVKSFCSPKFHPVMSPKRDNKDNSFNAR